MKDEELVCDAKYALESGLQNVITGNLIFFNFYLQIFWILYLVDNKTHLNNYPERIKKYLLYS